MPEWIRDMRWWAGPTYSTVVDGMFLYAGKRHGRDNFYSLAAMPVEYVPARSSPDHNIGDSMPNVSSLADERYATLEDAEEAALGIERVELCQECFTRHKPGENKLCTN